MDELAQGTLIGFIVALGVAGVLMVGLLTQSQDAQPAVDDNPVSQKVLEEKAQSISQIVLDTPGHTTAGGDWIDSQAGADGLERLGLRASGSAEVDFYKLLNLRLAPRSSAPSDGFVNYEDARASLGLDDEGLDMHIRAKPRLRSLDELLYDDDRDEYLKVAYLGNAVDTSGDAQVMSVSCNGRADSDSILFTIVAFNDGGVATQLTAVLTVGQGGSAMTQTINGPVVLTQQQVTFQALVPAWKTSWCASGTKWDVELYDPDVRVGTATGTFAAPTTAPTVAVGDMSLDTTLPYFVLGADSIVLAYDSQLISADPPADPSDPAWQGNLLLTVTDASNNVVVGPEPHFFSEAADRVLDLTDELQATGTYTATLAYDGETVASELIVVTSSIVSALSTGQWYWHSAVPSEVEQVEQIVRQFCPYEHDSDLMGDDSPLDPNPDYGDRCGHLSGTLKGSIFPDLKSTMNNDLPSYLVDSEGNGVYDHFTILVVGSEVDHNAMTSASAKHAIRDWVYGGGTLVVFGSAEQSVTWLQPIFHSAIQSSSEGTGTPDNLHPVLHTPDPLDWDEYVNPDNRAWVFNAGAGDYFTNVVTTSDETAAVLALSDPGDFGNGNVYLTTWQPYNIYNDPAGANPEAQHEGMKLIHNLFMMGYRDLYLDYGPAIPPDATVMTAEGLRMVEHPQLGPKPLAFTVYVFGSTS